MISLENTDNGLRINTVFGVERRGGRVRRAEEGVRSRYKGPKQRVRAKPHNSLLEHSTKPERRPSPTSAKAELSRLERMDLA